MTKLRAHILSWVIINLQSCASIIRPIRSGFFYAKINSRFLCMYTHVVIIQLSGGDEDAAEVVLVQGDQHHDGDAEAHAGRLHADFEHLMGGKNGNLSWHWQGDNTGWSLSSGTLVKFCLGRWRWYLDRMKEDFKSTYVKPTQVP